MLSSNTFQNFSVLTFFSIEYKVTPTTFITDSDKDSEISSESSFDTNFENNPENTLTRNRRSIMKGTF